MILEGIAGTAVKLFVTLNLATSFLIVGGRRVDTAIKMTVLQALLLSGIAGILGWVTGKTEIYFAALLTVAVKGGIIPYVLHKVEGRVGAAREAESYVNIKMSLVICAALVILSTAVTGRLIEAGPALATTVLPTAVSMMLIGLFIMITRKLAIMQIIGLLIMENGLFLAGVGTASGLPLVVELGVFLDILVGVLIMGILTFRINRTFDNINTDNLKKLRG